MSRFNGRFVPAAALLAALSLSLLGATAAHAVVVFSNFPDGGATSGGGSALGANRLKDIRFTVGSAAYTLDSVEAIMTGSGGSATLSLFTDSAGVPGTLIGAIDTEVINGTSALFTFVPGSAFALATDTTYHLVMGGGDDIIWEINANNTPASARNGSGFSNYNTTFSFDNGANWSASAFNSQLQINASAVAVPEAGTFALSLPALGMVGAVVARRRRK